MQKYFLVLLTCFVNIAYAQNASTISLGGSNSTNEETSVTTEEVKSSRLENVKNNFSRSIVSSPNEYAGVVLTYMPGINIEGKDYLSFSGNYLFSSLWGIKVISEKSKFYEENADNKVSSFKIGANKLFPAYSNFAFEAGLFYENGKVEVTNISDYGSDIDSDSKTFSAGNALVGVNFFSGSFVAGVQFQQRFASTNIILDSLNRFKKATTFTGNIGICF